MSNFRWLASFPKDMPKPKEGHAQVVFAYKASNGQRFECTALLSREQVQAVYKIIERGTKPQ